MRFRQFFAVGFPEFGYPVLERERFQVNEPDFPQFLPGQEADGAEVQVPAGQHSLFQFLNIGIQISQHFAAAHPSGCLRHGFRLFGERRHMFAQEATAQHGKSCLLYLIHP